MASEGIPRYQPCYILQDSNIPCVVWCEDAVAHYGVPTVVFSLYLLVPDIEVAAGILMETGWIHEDENNTRFGNALLRSAHRRLTPPVDATKSALWRPEMDPPPPPSKEPPGPTTTILLPASQWNFDFSGTSEQSFIPPLPALLDGLIDTLLDDPLTDSMFWGHLCVLIGHLYGYTPALKCESFAEELKYEHRQFHYDPLSGMSTGTLPFIHHQRKIREALRNNTHELCDCSADRDDENLFTAKAQARIIALTPPFPLDIYEDGNYEDEE